MRTTVGLCLTLFAGLAAGPAAAQTCGNFLREVPEQCDDGNVRNLDGCDAGCRFEHTQRINDLQMQFATAPECTANRLGEAFGSTQARGLVQNSISAGYASTLFHVLGLDDPAAVDDAFLEVGLLAAVPIVPGSTVYNENTSADWW
jgi:cysteine-rich repeat protein